MTKIKPRTWKNEIKFNDAAERRAEARCTFGVR